MVRKLPTILVLLVMVLVGAMYWIDLTYYTDPVTGFVTRGTVWVRYAVVALPILMCLLGLRTVGPKAISVFRMKSRVLGWVFGIAAVAGMAWGGALIAFSISPANWFRLALGLSTVWYGVWMLLASRQMVRQKVPSPTRSAVWGMLAALPFVLTTIWRILVRPSTLYRVAPLVRSLSGLLAMLWFGMLLRAFYIALPRRRVRWLYLLGVLTFLFSTCLELPLTVYNVMFADGGYMEMLEAVSMGMVGLVAGFVSVEIAGQSGAVPKQLEDALAG